MQDFGFFAFAILLIVLTHGEPDALDAFAKWANVQASECSRQVAP